MILYVSCSGVVEYNTCTLLGHVWAPVKGHKPLPRVPVVGPQLSHASPSCRWQDDQRILWEGVSSLTKQELQVSADRQLPNLRRFCL